MPRTVDSKQLNLDVPVDLYEAFSALKPGMRTAFIKHVLVAARTMILSNQDRFEDAVSRGNITVGYLDRDEAYREVTRKVYAMLNKREPDRKIMEELHAELRRLGNPEDVYSDIKVSLVESGLIK